MGSVHVNHVIQSNLNINVEFFDWETWAVSRYVSDGNRKDNWRGLPVIIIFTLIWQTIYIYIEYILVQILDLAWSDLTNSMTW